ncbi:DJ-1/PfpI family protein [uncultured Caulobacter sp.]|uniref:DJ-1/PfpI family protein n=1 Tax=uncultured Caulobacter sp. TaxID=158749 RepID=UPI0026078CDA|nr:DJ-1/PfpI family protein [uncultured Caulobacter sp.]
MMRLLVLFLVLMAGSPALARPLVVILAEPRGTETTDLIAPYAVLAESGAVDVRILAPSLAPVRLMPGRALVRPQATYADLRQRPDVIVVPFMMPAVDPAREAWLRERAREGARIVSICAGAETLAHAGLLDGREATTHWYELNRLAKAYPKARWRRDRRWIVDGPATTTAGVTASIPASLALLRDLAGEDVMRSTAARLGVPLPVQAHDGAAFRVNGDAAMSGLAGWANAWRGEKVAVKIADGFDDLAFATTLDAWSRTNRSEAFASASAVSRHGLAVIAPAKLPRANRTVEPGAGDPTAVLNEISATYGKATARYVALTLEHPYWLQK